MTFILGEKCDTQGTEDRKWDKTWSMGEEDFEFEVTVARWCKILSIQPGYMVESEPLRLPCRESC